MPDNGSKVEWVGIREAMRDLERWATDLGPAIVAGSQSLAESIASRTSNRVPVLTGTLAASVEVLDVEDAGAVGLGITIGDDVPYAGWIEFGGSRGRALVPEGRYLYPTAQEATDEYERLVADIAEDTARRYPWSTPSTTST